LGSVSLCQRFNAPTENLSQFIYPPHTSLQLDPLYQHDDGGQRGVDVGQGGAGADGGAGGPDTDRQPSHTLHSATITLAQQQITTRRIQSVYISGEVIVDYNTVDYYPVETPCFKNMLCQILDLKKGRKMSVKAMQVFFIPPMSSNNSFLYICVCFRVKK
jgi:hypothetical protein